MSWSLYSDNQSAYGTSNPATCTLDVDSSVKLVVVNVWIIGAQITRTGGSPTAGGQAMTDSGEGAVSQVGSETTIESWYLINPPTGSSPITINVPALLQ